MDWEGGGGVIYGFEVVSFVLISYYIWERWWRGEMFGMGVVVVGQGPLVGCSFKV